MENQKLINLLVNTPNQPTKFRTKNRFEINDDSRGSYNTYGQIRFKISMLKSSFCDYSDADIPVNGTIIVPNTRIAANQNNRKNMIIKNCAPFIDRIRSGKHLETSKTSGSLWQYYRDEPFLDANGAIADFLADDYNSISFKFKTKKSGKIENGNTNYVKNIVSLKYFSNFWRTLEMPLINFKINFILTWSANCFIIDDRVANQIPTITNN